MHVSTSSRILAVIVFACFVSTLPPPRQWEQFCGSSSFCKRTAQQSLYLPSLWTLKLPAWRFSCTGHREMNDWKLNQRGLHRTWGNVILYVQLHCPPTFPLGSLRFTVSFLKSIPPVQSLCFSCLLWSSVVLYWCLLHVHLGIKQMSNCNLA